MRRLWQNMFAPIGHLGKHFLHLRAHVKTLVFITICSMLTLAGPLATPQLLRLIIDVAYPTRNMRLFWSVSAVVIGISIVLSAVSGLGSYLETRLRLNIRSHIQRQLFRTLNRLRMSHLDKVGPGPMGERISRDSEEIARAMVVVIPSICALPTLAVGAMVQMGRISPLITASVLVVLPIHCYITMVSSSVIRKMTHRLRAQTDRLRNVVDECFHGIEVLKVFHWQRAKQYRRYDDVVDDIVEREVSIWRQGYLFSSLAGLMTQGWGLALTLIGMFMMFQNRLQLGEAMALGMYTAILLRPFSEIIGLYKGLISASVAAERVAELEKEEVRAISDAGIQPKTEQGVIAQCVSFSYAPDRPSLRDISLRLYPGKVMALVGANGSGKTTLLKLLANYYSDYSGDIHFRGRELRTFDPDAYAGHIAVVWGKNHFFHGTVLENCEQEGSAARENVVQVAEALGCDTWIRSLEKGYDTVLGHDGVGLSAGETFKVALIRAMVKNPAVLLIDELGSYWDSVTDETILKGLSQLRPADGITVLVTHKREIATHPWVDHVVLLSNGRQIHHDSPQVLFNESWRNVGPPTNSGVFG